MVRASMRRRRSPASARACADCANAWPRCTVPQLHSMSAGAMPVAPVRGFPCRACRRTTMAATTDTRARALVVEDGPWARAGLCTLLGEIDWLVVAGEAASGPAAIAALDALRPELVFMDIQMPGCSGLEVLARAGHRP